MSKKKIAVLSDIHGNAEALETVMDDLQRELVDEIIFLGDIIGYGPDPCRCLDIVLALKNKVILRGNHEDILLGRVSSANCSGIGKISAEWNSQNIPQSYYKDILGFIESHQDYGISFFHTAKMSGSLDYPYLNKTEQIVSEFADVVSDVIFYGHTHRPRITVCKSNKCTDVYIKETTIIDIVGGNRYYINVGSVGQQRDNITDCSYALIDINDTAMHVTIKRMQYDSYKTYKKIQQRIKSDEIATYLIREEQRRNRYEDTYYGR